MKRKKSGVMIVDPGDMDKYLTAEERREERDLAETQAQAKEELKTKALKELAKKRREAIRLEKEATAQAECFIRFPDCYDGPWTVRRGKDDHTKAPDYTGEGSDIDLVNSYI